MRLLTDHHDSDLMMDDDDDLDGLHDLVPIKFSIPADCRMFTPFTRLPPEIRHKIWGWALTTPGMHFLKIAPVAEKVPLQKWWKPSTSSLQSRHSSDDEEIDEITEEVKVEKKPDSTMSVKLTPLYPTPEADISYFTTLNKELAKLSTITAESAAIAQSLVSRSIVLTLGSGRVISLDPGADVIYLEYVPPDVFGSGFAFTQALECPEFEKIRRVAVRYCHGWYEQHSSRRCPHCGRFHGRSDRVSHPHHLYQFLAQYLPNLEYFYFVDYFILRKPTHGDDLESGEPLGHSKTPSCVFQSGNRKYYEAEDEYWNVTSKVFEMKTWLEDRFVRYANASTLSNHKSPEKVKFGVLSCEWAVAPPVESKPTPVKAARKGRNKRAFCEEHTMRKSRQTSYGQSPKTATPIIASTNLPFVFGASERTNFEFTFTMPL